MEQFHSLVSASVTAKEDRKAGKSGTEATFTRQSLSAQLNSRSLVCDFVAQ